MTVIAHRPLRPRRSSPHPLLLGPCAASTPAAQASLPQDWCFDAQDLAALQAAPPRLERWLDAQSVVGSIGSSAPAPGRSRTSAAYLGGAAGLGLVGAALLGAAPAQAAPIEFPAWAAVTGSVPDDAGLDRAAAEANDWTFSWSTDAAGVVTFEYADGSRSSSLDPTARRAAPPADADAAGTGELSVQSLGDPLWAEGAQADPGSPETRPGLDDLAAAAATPFGPSPVSAQTEEPPAPSEGPGVGGVSDQAILDTAAQGLGGQYVWGGTAFKAWDCSAFVQWVYAQHGIEIPRVTWEQFAAAQPTSDPRPGDLVSQNGGSHVGIYLGGDRMISALNPQQGTIEHSVHDMALDGYYTVR